MVSLSFDDMSFIAFIFLFVYNAVISTYLLGSELN